jgi:hypothetical protein
MCEFLLENGIDVNAKDCDNNTALSYAKNEDLVELLIKYGADVNNKDKYGMTRLMKAAREGEKKICELLIKNSADVNATNIDGYTALTFALMDIKIDKIDLYEFLLKLRPYGKKNEKIEICELLIEHGGHRKLSEKDYELIQTNGLNYLFEKILIQSRRDAFDRRKHILFYRNKFRKENMSK